MSDAAARPQLTFAQGIHIVLDRKFLPSDDAVMIPKTSDGRVLFCIPWHNHVLVGTTDTPVSDALLEPKALSGEIDFILETAGKYLKQRPSRSDILSTFAGIRPLIRNNARSKTSALSRGHELFVDGSGLITITGGKWTTYRRMAEDAVDKAIEIGVLDTIECRTETMAIIPSETAEPDEKLHPGHTYTLADIVHATRREMARTVEDVLARRTRMLFLDAKAAVDAAPVVAELMAKELQWNEDQKNEKLRDFLALASSYQIHLPANNV